MQPIFPFLPSFETLITIIGVVSPLLPFLLSLRKKESFKKFKFTIFLSGFAVTGVTIGILMAVGSHILGIGVAILLVIFIIILGRNRKVFLNILLDQQSTIVTTKLVLYNLLCETIQRICIALIEEIPPVKSDIRVSLFSVDWVSKELLIVGRYPLVSDQIPPVKYKIGQGTSGMAAQENQIIIKEHLPSWDDDQDTYIKEMGSYHVDESAIRGFNVKSRCYYTLPIEYRDSSEGVNVVRFIVSIDSISPTISSGQTSSGTVVKVIDAFIQNQRDLLIKSFIGISH